MFLSGFRYLVVDEAGVDPERSARALLRGFPGLSVLGERRVACVGACIRAAERLEGLPAAGLSFQFQFCLARALKRCLPGEWRETIQGESTARVLAPFALLFKEAIDHFDVLPTDAGAVDWNDDDQVMADFVATYRKVRYVEGEDPLVAAHAAAQRAADFPLANRYERLLTGIACQLQFAQPGEPILLPRKRVAELLGVSPQLVSRLVENLVADGYLQVASSDYSFTRGVAKSYWFRHPGLHQITRASGYSGEPGHVGGRG